MKRALIYTLVFSLILSLAVFPVSAITFTDMAESHWAYANVQKLVEEGTVSGYEDGSFRPNGTVTRAEFVKMVGESDVTRTEAYADVAASHWAYSYIMKADFPQVEDNLFQPNAPITRGLAAELLWRRNGKLTGIYVPSVITAQYARNTEAIAWAYATGLMQGDDGVNLRAEGTLSRAEATALIIRSREGKAADSVFAETVSPKILENVHKALNLFEDMTYTPDKKLTNGEVARAALRIGGEQWKPTYAGVSAAFEHDYAKDVTAVFAKALGKSGIDAAFADKAAGFGDTVAALANQFIKKSNEGLVYGAQTEGLPATVTSETNTYLTFAKRNGVISLEEDLNAPVTLRDFTALCLLFDQLGGSQTDIITEKNANGKFIRKDHALLLTEEPYGDFRAMLEGVPQAVYTTAFQNVEAGPAACYEFARQISSIYMDFLASLQEKVKANSGTEVRFTFSPSLVVANGNGFTLRVACDIIKLDGTKTFNELFAVQPGMAGADTELAAGNRVYFDLATGSPLTAIIIPVDKAYAEQIIYVEK